MLLKHPKRKRDKDNPYELSIENGHYYIRFVDSTQNNIRLEIESSVYELFNETELMDARNMYFERVHLDKRGLGLDLPCEAIGLSAPSAEDEYLRGSRTREILKAIDALPAIRKRRFEKYVFQGKRLAEIAEEEGCSIAAVGRSVDKARRNLRFFLENTGWGGEK